MSAILISRPHTLTPDQARHAAEALAEQLTTHHDIRYRWEGNSLHFERSGVSGSIELEPGEIRIKAQLGFFLMPFRHTLEQEIHRRLDESFPLPA